MTREEAQQEMLKSINRLTSGVIDACIKTIENAESADHAKHLLIQLKQRNDERGDQ